MHTCRAVLRITDNMNLPSQSLSPTQSAGFDGFIQLDHLFMKPTECQEIFYLSAVNSQASALEVPTVITHMKQGV